MLLRAARDAARLLVALLCAAVHLSAAASEFPWPTAPGSWFGINAYWDGCYTNTTLRYKAFPTVADLAYAYAANYNSHNRCADPDWYFVASIAELQESKYFVVRYTCQDGRRTCSSPYFDTKLTPSRTNPDPNYVPPDGIMPVPPPPPQTKAGAYGTTANNNICARCGDPISFDRGSVILDEVDYRGAGSSPLRFIRHYDSKNPFTSDTGIMPAMGNRWNHNYDVGLIHYPKDDLAVIRHGDGSVLHFKPQALDSTAWAGDAGVNGSLTKTTTGWTYRGIDDAVEYFDLTGRMTSRVERNGMTQTLTYNSDGRLEQVQDSFGRILQFSYATTDAITTLAQLTLPDGQKIAYNYSSEGNLTKVTYQDGRRHLYSYLLPSMSVGNARALITGLVDENTSDAGWYNFSTWSYDSNNLAVKNELIGGVARYAVSYTRDAAGKISSAVVTDPLARQRTYTFGEAQGISMPLSGTSPVAGMLPVQQIVDVNGNVTSYLDFNGNKTTYVYDLTRNLEISRTEAAGTPQARTITTEWHATYRLPIRITEPGRVVSMTYDDKGNLQQKDINAGGSTRSWRYTYNSFGQILTAKGPRSDISDITTYSYDAQGNLATITNTLGHTTRITSYDAHGAPLTIIDPNGMTTNLTYDSRQRLVSRDVDGEMTRYDYDGVGQLVQVTFPDNSSLRYTYDAAHRLTKIADNLGNSINYTLDAMGNRIGENVTNGGTLIRKTTRLFDEMNRLKQITGGMQ